jgi:hypothetical protein
VFVLVIIHVTVVVVFVFVPETNKPIDKPTIIINNIDINIHNKNFFTKEE